MTVPARAYYLSGPKDLAPGEKRPLVLAFHGSGGEGSKIVNNWARLAQKERFFVAGLKSLIDGIGPSPKTGQILSIS